MLYRTLGKTGLKVSLASYGTGGYSRAGQSTGMSEAQSIDIVRKALDHGINLIDTAEGYRTEEIVGRAISTRSPDACHISTKVSLYKNKVIKTGPELILSLEESLKKLRREFVDIYHLHGVAPQDYDYALQEFVPAMLKMKEQGKIRFTGITERFESDPGHEMMSRACREPAFDVLMVGFNVINQSARDRVFKLAKENLKGVLCMFAVRRALVNKERLNSLLAKLIDEGHIDKDIVDPGNPLFLSGSMGLTEAAYRFCTSEEGIDSILFGTGNPEHMRQNIENINSGPISIELRNKLMDVFKKVDSVSAD